MRSIQSSSTLVALGAVLVSTGALAAREAPSRNVEIRTLSNRADLVSGGDALVEVRLPRGVQPQQVTLRLNGQNVGGQLKYKALGRRFVGVVDGLAEGANQFTVEPSTGGRAFASLTITNHSRGGPIFSGPHLQPWVCATRDGATVTLTDPHTGNSAPVVTRVSGLDADPVDAKCNAPSKVSYYYQPKAKEGGSCTFTLAGADPCFVPYDSASPPAPEDIASFTNDRGTTVRSILRVERGTMNRSIYQIVAYDDPLARSAALRHRGWNSKLLWMFGASAGSSRFQTPVNVNTVFNDEALRRGFMVASSSLNDNGTNANEVLAAETLMMVKEHIVEQYGEIRYTIGNGCSGGSIQQQSIAAAYPGLLDGIQPYCSYQDSANVELEIKDCGLLAGQYFNTPTGALLSPAQRSAIAGHNNTGFCLSWVGSFLPVFLPNIPSLCGSGFPAALGYNATTNPQGVRCGLGDHLANLLGTYVDVDGVRKPNNGFDNVGVQYGLKALRDGVIGAEEFVALNESAGSYTPDLTWQGPVGGAPAPRAAASPATLASIYHAAIAGDPRLLAQVAIIDLRGDQNPAGDIHANWRAWAQRARLDQANGHHDNQLIWAFSPGLAPGAALARKSFLTMDRWLEAVHQDRRPWLTRAEKVVAHRPADVHDFCLPTPGNTDAELSQEMPLDAATCPVKYQASPRQAAGGPLAEDIFKCQLQPMNLGSAEYGGAVFTPAQQARLQAVFAGGVCDWSKAGVGQQPSPGWITFASGVGIPLPPPPSSAP